MSTFDDASALFPVTSPAGGCGCGGTNVDCMCAPAERALRQINTGTRTFTPEQREWAVTEADRCYEGAYARSNCGM